MGKALCRPPSGACGIGRRRCGWCGRSFAHLDLGNTRIWRSRGRCRGTWWPTLQMLVRTS